MRALKKNLFSIFILLLIAVAGHSQMRMIYRSYIPGDNDEVSKLSFYSPSEGFVSFKHWIGYTSDSGRHFIKREITFFNVDYNGYYVNLTFGFAINGIHAFDRNTLLVYGHYGFKPAILRSVDGGQSFKLIYQSLDEPSLELAGVADMVFAQNSSTGYAIDGYKVLKSVDKGQSWQVVKNDPGFYLDALECVDNNNLFAYSQGTDTYNPKSRKLFKSTNGGSSWIEMKIPVVNYLKITAVDFLTINKGWLSLYDDQYKTYFFSTTDGGNSWTLQNDPDAAHFEAYDLNFINDTTGYALTGLFEVWKTTDNGKTWEPLPRDNIFSADYRSHNDLQVWSKDQLWAGGGESFLELTTNGGGVPLPKAYFKVDTTDLSVTKTVRLVNASKPSYQYQWYLNRVFVSNDYHYAYAHDIQKGKDTIMLVVSNGQRSDTLIKYQYFIVPPPIQYTTVTSFTPASASTDQKVMITGKNFTRATKVFFGTEPAASFKVLSDTSISAIVGEGRTGTVSVTTPLGTATLPGFTYTTRLKITSISPTSGPVGTTVTIYGTNFSPDLSANLVYFGGVKAQVIASSAYNITVKVPAGAAYQPVSVTVDSKTAYSRLPFLISFSDNCSFSKQTFNKPTEFPFTSTEGPDFIGSADLDNDGKPDIVTASALSSQVKVLRNTTSNHSISFEKEKLLVNPVSAYSSGLFTLADLDGDGRLDICTGKSGSSFGLSIFKNTSSPGVITFASSVEKDGFDGRDHISTADFDGDGKPDVFGQWSGGIQIIRNASENGTIQFDKWYNFNWANPGTFSYDCVSADINGDGKSDLILSTPYFSTKGISIRLNTTVDREIKFDTYLDIPVSGAERPYKIKTGDFDGDSKLDIAVLYSTAVDSTNTRISVFKNSGSGNAVSFNPAVDFVIKNHCDDFSLGDLNGDGKLDIVVSYRYNNSFSVQINNSDNGSISFTPAEYFTPQRLPFSGSSAIADFNLDGKSDIATFERHVNETTYESKPALAVYENNICGTARIDLCELADTALTSNLSGSIYQWQQNNGSGFTDLSDNINFSGVTTARLSVTKAPLSLNGYEYRCVVNGVNSRSFMLYVNGNVIPNAVISTPNMNVCPGTNVTFTSTISNGGSTPVYQWQVNGTNAGTNSASFSTAALNNNDQVQLKLTSNALCAVPQTAFSNIIKMAVTGTPVTPTAAITATSSTICAGTTVTFNAAVSNGGDAPSYQWLVNGINVGTNSSTFSSSSLANGNQVKVIVTSNAACATPLTVTSNVIVMAVNQLATPSVSITSSVNEICSGSPITFTASVTNGGNNPGIQWQVNGINTGTNSRTFTSSALINNDQVRAIAQSNYACVTTATATSNLLVVKVKSSATANASTDKTICAGLNGVSIGTAGVPGNSYSWSPVQGLSSSSSAEVVANPATTTTYILTVTNSEGCTAKDTVQVSVLQTPDINATGATAFCQGGTVVLLSASATGNQWYANGQIIPGASSASYVATQSGNYTVKRTAAGCTSLPSNAISVTVSPFPETPHISQNGNLLTSSATSGNEWYLNDTLITGAGGQAFTATKSGKYKVRVNINGCAGAFSNVLTFTVIQGIFVGPNPVTDRLFIQFPGNTDLISVLLIDVNTGAKLESGNFFSSYEIDMKKYASGVYALEILNRRTGEKEIRKILKP